MQNSKIEELTFDEIEQVNGGIAPVIGAGIALASHLSSATLGGHLLSGAGLIVGTYGLLDWLSSK
ncbi:class IIb bacteriocin, lactobin A/cerein 7B family [Shewanella gaetbuli]|uniref:Class IIb bacteriocin, lactobin A/cerein 7B family n=1 Tax=Shewanella gaetbuli TaxID=220752 RepID=A0A9X2CGT6_9GAMM|nr:class IIb bacteriocin, lactobin A/cerein 7B family [Shewanella gaetbuli]MCL1142743.1 class IIb bacteriocin, lactobin A/cerein 7B family [Shewanella gaetbuli]